MTAVTAALPWHWTMAIVAFGGTQCLLLGYSMHRLVTIARWRRTGPGVSPPEASTSSAPAPFVTVQLPLFNEPAVVARAIDALVRLRYPAGQLEIQVLDDSTDGTTRQASALVEHWRSRGVDIELLHRDSRAGFKAGALAAGLARARGEFVAVFDADFLPRPDFLQRIMPRFSDPGVGMVQARWAHLNRGHNLLTSGQAVMLDAHFVVEHEARMASGLFFNFNGTAGVWRRAAIEGSGGWAHDTLTEDLDLSYRAQLAGWRFVVAGDVLVPGELPADVLALRSQQRRWAKGSIQTARKVLPVLLRSRLPMRLKSEAVMHLTANAGYPLLLLSALLLPAVLAVPSSLPPETARLLEMSAVIFGALPTMAFLLAGQSREQTPLWKRLSDLVAALIVGAGLALNNTLAVLEGLRPSLGDWERTPKTGDSGSTARPSGTSAARTTLLLPELAIAVYCLAQAAALVQQAHLRSTPILLLLGFSFAHAAWSARQADSTSGPEPAVRSEDPGLPA